MHKRDEGGQSVAELAILLPLLMLILLGCLDLGRAFGVWMTLANATREGARYVSLYPNATTAAVKSETEVDIVAAGLETDHLQVFVSLPETGKPGHPAIVTARYSLPMLTGFLFGGQPLVISASTQMVIIGGGN